MRHVALGIEWIVIAGLAVIGALAPDVACFLRMPEVPPQPTDCISVAGGPKDFCVAQGCALFQHGGTYQLKCPDGLVELNGRLANICLRAVAGMSGVIPVNVVSVVIYFAPFSHPHRTIAPAVFEITIGQAMHGLELVVFRLQESISFSHAVQLCLELVMVVLPIANFEVLGSLRNPKPPYFANQRRTVFKIK